MQLLKKVHDQLELRIICDLLESGGFEYRVDGAGINALMPLPGVIEARIMVADNDFEMAEALLADMEAALHFNRETEEGDHA